MKSKHRKTTDGASTFSKGLQVLACFESRQRSFTMAELAQCTGFDRAATRRLCLSLVQSGYLQKNEQQLRLTPKILAVAGGYLGSNDIGLSVQPVLDQFAAELRGEISLAVRDGYRAIYVASSKFSNARVSLGFTVGSTLPLLHTAIGRMILASLDESVQHAVFQQLKPHKFTSATELDVKKIRTQIEAARTQGFACVKNEFEMGAAGIAVPVGGLAGNEAVLGVTNSVNKLNTAGAQDRVLDVLRSAALALRRLSNFN